MNNSLKLALIFFGSAVVMFLIFYFYPAKLFKVEVVGAHTSYLEEIHLTAFLGIDSRFQDYLDMYEYHLSRKFSGWAIAFICLIGTPAMLTYRFSISNKNEQDVSAEEQE
jgi:hypothetical protein